MAIAATPSALPSHLRFPLHPTPSRPTTRFFHWTPKKPILGGGSRSDSAGRGRRWGLVWAAGRMTEMVGVGDEGEFGTGDGVREEDAILGGGSVADRAELVRNDVGSILNRMSKWIVAALFGIIIVLKHDAEILWAAAGSVLNASLSVTLKRMLNHQRPAPHLKSDPGMPSSHAQSIFYGAFFLIHSLIHWLGFNVVTVTVGLLTLGSSSYLTWLRVAQQYHTLNQVLVGAVLGSIISTAWFWSWHTFVLKAFISSIIVRLVVVLSSVISCVAFVLYVIRNWLNDDS